MLLQPAAYAAAISCLYCYNQVHMLLQTGAYAAAVHMLLHLLLRCICCCYQLYMLLQYYSPRIATAEL